MLAIVLRCPEPILAFGVIPSEAKDLAAPILAAVMVFRREPRQITRHKNAARDPSTPAAFAQDDKLLGASH